jgi:hypothetical protein
MKNIRLLSGLLLLMITPVLSWSKKETTSKSAEAQAQVLIVGLNDNVKSNYYFKEQIAEETGMQADSIVQQYNDIISRNIIAASANSACTFIPAGKDDSYSGLVDKIEVTGDGEDCNSNLSKLSTEELQTALEHAHADYLLVLNQHYLKWQQQPMRTVFHMVSYTLYDKNKKPVLSGNQYFTSMNLEKPERIAQISRKSSSKIASSIAKSLDL